MQPMVIGHRGARSLFPENTLEGITRAIALGVRHIEVDVAMTRDGVVVLSHDPWLNPALTREADGSWLLRPGPPIWNLDFAAVQRFDVGRLDPASRYGRAFPRQEAVDGVRIPSLASALRVDKTIGWTIEIKTSPRRRTLTAHPNDIADAVADVVDAAGAAHRVTVQSFDWRGPRHLRRRHPRMGYAWLTCSATRAWRGGQRGLPWSVVEEGGGTWSPRYTELTPRRLEAARGLDLRVVPWTVNAKNDVIRLATWGVDGIITDDPITVRSWLCRGTAWPSPTP